MPVHKRSHIPFVHPLAKNDFVDFVREEVTITADGGIELDHEGSTGWSFRGSELVNVTLPGSGVINGGVLHTGLFGGYPAPGWKCLWAADTNIADLIARGE